MVTWQIIGSRVTKRIGLLVKDILVESTAQANIDHLQPAADAQEGLSGSQHLLKKVQLDPVSVQVDVIDQRVGLAAVTLGLDIAAAREKHSIQARHKFVQGWLAQTERDKHRQGASLSQRSNIGFAQANLGMSVSVMGAIGGYTDQWSSHDDFIYSWCPGYVKRAQHRRGLRPGGEKHIMKIFV